MKPEFGQAAYIVFCAVLGLASAGLVLSIAVPAIGEQRKRHLSHSGRARCRGTIGWASKVPCMHAPTTNRRRWAAR